LIGSSRASVPAFVTVTTKEPAETAALTIGEPSAAPAYPEIETKTTDSAVTFAFVTVNAADASAARVDGTVVMTPLRSVAATPVVMLVIWVGLDFGKMRPSVREKLAVPSERVPTELRVTFLPTFKRPTS